MNRALFGSFLLLAIYYCAVYAQKRGSCPPPANVGVCSITCIYDHECAGDAKCCRTACGGSICVRPMLPPPPQNNNGEKAGRCPAHPPGPWVCSNRCSFDVDCRGKLKCCKNRCGAMTCIKPE